MDNQQNEQILNVQHVNVQSDDNNNQKINERIENENNNYWNIINKNNIRYDMDNNIQHVLHY